MVRGSDFSGISGTSFQSSASSGGSFASSYGGSIDSNIIAGDPRANIPKFRTVKRAAPRRRNGCDALALYIFGIGLIGLLALILEAVAYDVDFNWNLIVRADRELPVINDETYFNGKMIHLDTSTPDLETVMSYLVRQGGMEATFVAIMTIFLTIFLVSTVLYTQGEGSQTNLSGFHMIGGFFIFISAILIIVSDTQVDTNHEKAANALQRYYENRSAYPEPVSQVPYENRELMLEQLIIMIQIQDLCTLSKSRHGRYIGSWGVEFIQINKRSYHVSDLQYYGFCSRQDLKFAAFILSLLYSILCFGVPCFVVYVNHRVAKFTRAVGFQPSANPSVAGIGNGEVPPAYGYGYPPNNLIVPGIGIDWEKFDPRFAPVAPREDLAADVNTFNDPRKSITEEDSIRYKKLARESFDASSMNSSTVSSYR